MKTCKILLQNFITLGDKVMVNLMNINTHDEKFEALVKAIEIVLSCEDSKYIEEIYAKDGSFRNGLLTDWVGLMIELNPEFVNKSLYDAIDAAEDNCSGFALVISTEPNTVERGHGTVLWVKEG